MAQKSDFATFAPNIFVVVCVLSLSVGAINIVCALHFFVVTNQRTDFFSLLVGRPS